MTDNLSETALKRAASEYSKSPRFKNFVISALSQFTDIPADPTPVEFNYAADGDRAILIKPIYRNSQTQARKITFASGENIELDARDTIRLLLTRKYTAKGVSDLLSLAGLEADNFQRDIGFPGSYTGPHFYLRMMMLKRKQFRKNTEDQFDIFISYARQDTNIAGQIYEKLKPFCRVFFDQESIDPGVPWRSKIKEAMDRSHIIVILISEHTAGSNFQNIEIHESLFLSASGSLGPRIIPVVLYRSDFEYGELPFGLGQFNAIPLPGHDHLTGLVEKLRKLLKLN